MSAEDEVTHPLVEQVTIAIKDQLALLKEGISEYQLIETLQSEPYRLFDKEALRESRNLFQTHFLLFHCLYTLRDEWRQKQTGELVISATKIKLNTYIAQNQAMTEVDPLRTYYLNWSHFSRTTESDVDDMLNSFWKAMSHNVSGTVNAADRISALDTLGFAPDSAPTIQQIKRQYRALQHQNHPDKGGSLALSQSLTAAYKILMVNGRDDH
ncbi:molecular chaperone DnaJ [Salinimonas sp. HHU 13199]|uniref:Molecular chaperone DnaJ n=1 Tax=Salinimonas profundi TaxID=2729140 RepID=A0ABR8LNN6_9ALTE|nr:DNA-J related domain-containing protein [Salinimonas profundi]MBD3586526.1 molecular chaperone DnaJ [Salinimonas profundi]